MLISRVMIRATPFRVLRTLLITYLLCPLPLQVVSPNADLEVDQRRSCGSCSKSADGLSSHIRFRAYGSGFRV